MAQAKPDIEPWNRLSFLKYLIMAEKKKEEELPREKPEMKRKRTFRKKLTDAWDVIVAAGKGFSEDKVPKLSGSLAYFTVFSIPPLITIILSIGTIVIANDHDVRYTLFSQLDQIVGEQISKTIEDFANNASLSGKSNIALVIGIVSLIIGSTAVFTEIQDSINTIWEVKAKPKKGWLKMLTNRLLSFSIVVGLGFILLVSLVISGILNSMQGQLQAVFPGFSQVIITAISTLVSLAVITFLFAVIFKVLPDVVLPWKPALIGAGITAVLFGIGKFLIDIYIEKANPGLVFGAAGSVAILFVWVYYTAFILYFGAELTQAVAEKYYDGIKPSKYAVHLKVVEEEKNVTELPPQHPEETAS